MTDTTDANTESEIDEMHWGVGARPQALSLNQKRRLAEERRLRGEVTADSPARMGDAMSKAETQTPPDLDAIERDARAKVEALEAQRQRLAPEALVSARGKSELADLESELAEARRALELVPLARSEGARRETEAALAAVGDKP